MEEGNPELKNWLEQSKNQDIQFESGEIPVVGWLQLLQTIQATADREPVQEELKQTESEIRKLEGQLQTLLQKKENLGNELKKRENLAALKIGTANQQILKFAEKEKIRVTQLHETLNSYLELDSQDVSTIFSLYKMDHLFGNYKNKESIISPEEILNSSVEHLKKDLAISFQEAVEMQFKFQLLQNEEFSVDHHLSKCSICSRTNLLAILGEYGVKLNENERNNFLEKSKDWKGYFLIALTTVKAIQLLELPPGLRGKAIGAVNNIQKAHKYLFDE